jgi:hypothetical protein
MTMDIRLNNLIERKARKNNHLKGNERKARRSFFNASNVNF